MCLPLKSTVDLLLDPLPAFRFVCLDVHVVDHRAQVFKRVKIDKQLVHIVGHLILVTILEAQSLLVQLADAIDALVDVIVVDECLRGLVSGKLDQKNRVAFVHLSSLRRWIDRYCM